eukprot:TRINITY_DN1250_c0_g1_i2.p1 TRINITY_DN1250_c0_g1~~TRINITY_DN1250_c0_g1_i2.p1  ORF type:complete len:865 (+),score=91.92 TRINITY_DN1250_c0_g1_i2:1536-4130(+)
MTETSQSSDPSSSYNTIGLITTNGASSSACGRLKESFKSSHLVKVFLIVLLLGILALAALFVKADVDHNSDVEVNEKGRTENSKLESQLQALKKTLQEKEAEIEDLKKQVINRDDQIAKLQEEIKDLEGKKKEIQGKIDEAKKRQGEQEQEISQLQSQINQKNSEIEANKQKIATLEEEVKAKDAVLAQLKKTRMYYQIGAGASVLVNLIVGVDSVLTHIAISSNKKKIVELQEGNEKLKKEIANLIDALNNKTKEVEQLKNQVETLDKQITELKNTIATLENQKADLQRQINEYKNMKNELQGKYDTLQKNYNELKEKYDKLVPKYNEVKKQYDGVLNKYEEALKRYVELNDSYTNKNEKYEQLSKDYVDLNDTYIDLNKTHHELNNTYIDLKEQYVELTQKYDKLKNEYNDLNNSYHELLDKYEQLKLDYKYLQGNYTELEENYTDLENTYNDLKANYTKLSEEYSKLEKEYVAVSDKLCKAALDLVRLYYLQHAKGTIITTEHLYSSSEHGFKRSELDAKLDGIGPLLMIIGTSDNYYFGAFINEKWSKTDGSHKDGKAFTFSLNLTELCYITDPDNAYVVSSDALISFGKGDIVIKEQTNDPDVKKWTTGTAEAGITYALPSGFDPKKFYHDGVAFTVTALDVYQLKVVKPQLNTFMRFIEIIKQLSSLNNALSQCQSIMWPSFTLHIPLYKLFQVKITKLYGLSHEPFYPPRTFHILLLLKQPLLSTHPYLRSTHPPNPAQRRKNQSLTEPRNSHLLPKLPLILGNYQVSLFQLLGLSQKEPNFPFLPLALALAQARDLHRVQDSRSLRTGLCQDRMPQYWEMKDIGSNLRQELFFAQPYHCIEGLRQSVKGLGRQDLC